MRMSVITRSERIAGVPGRRIFRESLLPVRRFLHAISAPPHRHHGGEAERVLVIDEHDADAR